MRRRRRSRSRRAAALTGLLVALVASTLVCGYVGLREYYPGASYSRADLVYMTLQLFALQLTVEPARAGWALEYARFMAAALAGYAIVRALALLFAGELLVLRLRWRRGHTIICGLGRKGLQLAEGLLDAGERVVIIENDEDNDHLTVARELGALCVLGDATDPHILARANLWRARRLIALAGNDGTNVEIVLRARGLPEATHRRGAPLACHVHIVDLRLSGLLRQSRLLSGEEPARHTVRVFNVFENSARLLLHEHPLDHVHIAEKDPRTVHLVVVGLGQMGESLVLQAARIGHFASGKAPRITVVDVRAEQKGRLFCARYPGLEHAASLRFLEGHLEDPRILSELATLASDAEQVATVAICLDDDHRSLRAALQLNERLLAQKLPIRVRMAHRMGLAALSRSADGSIGLSVFGLLDELCKPDAMLGETLDRLARACHEEYLARKLATEPLRSRPALFPWDDLDETYRESNRQQADHIPVKLRAIGCTIRARAPEASAPPVTFSEDETKLLAQMEHARWCADRWLAGYTWGPGDPDPVRRTHPCLVPWAKLGESHQDNDRAAVGNIPRLLALAGQEIVRLP